METEVSQETFAYVTAIKMENGTPFHAHVIGLTKFEVPLQQALEDGFMLSDNSVN